MPPAAHHLPTTTCRRRRRLEAVKYDLHLPKGVNVNEIRRDDNNRSYPIRGVFNKPEPAPNRLPRRGGGRGARRPGGTFYRRRRPDRLLRRCPSRRPKRVTGPGCTGRGEDMTSRTYEKRPWTLKRRGRTRRCYGRFNGNRTISPSPRFGARTRLRRRHLYVTHTHTHRFDESRHSREGGNDECQRPFRGGRTFRPVRGRPSSITIGGNVRRRNVPCFFGRWTDPTRPTGDLEMSLANVPGPMDLAIRVVVFF